MNNKHILDLTLRLSQSLDQNYDVVSMDTVLSVITALEGTTITKEQLEATRLAKYINQLRRRTKCENLARRAKSLLKKWREMVGIQQSNESSAGATTTTVGVPSVTTSTSYNMPVVTDNAVPTSSHLTHSYQLSHQHYYNQIQFQSNVKQQQQLYLSQPSSPVNLRDKTNPNEFLISMSNPATGTQMANRSSINTNIRKKKRQEKNLDNDAITLPSQQLPQQPTSFKNLLTGLGSNFGKARKISSDKPNSIVETFIIEHSSNSNSDLICLPSTNNTVSSSHFTSATDDPPVVIDLQDTNSSMNSCLVSKDLLTTPFNPTTITKTSAKKSKKEKKLRKERNVVMLRQQQDCDDQNTTATTTITTSYHHKPPSDALLMDEKSNSACPTISNISEILSLSNSSMSSVFPSAEAISKNMFQSGQNDSVSLTNRMSVSDLTFAGKFKQNNTSVATGCNTSSLTYNSDNNMNINLLSSYSPSKQSKFSLFGGDMATNSNDSTTSNSRNSQFNVIVNDTTAVPTKQEASNSKYCNEEDFVGKHDDFNEKSSLSNMSSNKGNSSTDNAIATIVASTNVAATQLQQPIDLTMTDFSTLKQPKKRGRKKGSKGVDSVIAKETSLSSQMLLSSLSVVPGKKVKTTKELYAEMENRKLRKVESLTEAVGGNSSLNWISQQQQKPQNFRRASFCSDIAESDSCTMTSEPSRDSANIVTKTLDLQTNEVSKGSEQESRTTTLSTTSAVTKIKHEIQEIVKMLTPPLSVKEIEQQCLKTKTPCTCTIEEIIAVLGNDNKNNKSCFNDDGNSFDMTNNNRNSANDKQQNHLKSELLMDNIKDANVNADNVDKNLKVDLMSSTTIPNPLAATKLKKSIFDLDFEDDEDPLNSIIADIRGVKTEIIKTTTPLVIEEKNKIPLSSQQQDNDLTKKVVQQNITQCNLNQPTTTTTSLDTQLISSSLPSYQIKYDPECKAKNRFEVQTQKITKYHIDILHNCFIPNVNGNWNHAAADNKLIGNENYNEDISVTDGYNVVPLYGWNVNEHIVKDLRQMKFSKKSAKVKTTDSGNEMLYQIPFLGVSRVTDEDKVKFYGCSDKEIDNLKMDEEEKENVHNKLILKTTKEYYMKNLEYNDAKNDMDMERIVKNVMDRNTNRKKSSNKRRKKYKNLEQKRCNTIKRLKISNGNSESYTKNTCPNGKKQQSSKNIDPDSHGVDKQQQSSKNMQLNTSDSDSHVVYKKQSSKNMQLNTKESDFNCHEVVVNDEKEVKANDDDNTEVKNLCNNDEQDNNEFVVNHDNTDLLGTQKYPHQHDHHIVLTIKKNSGCCSKKSNSPLTSNMQHATIIDTNTNPKTNETKQQRETKAKNKLEKNVQYQDQRQPKNERYTKKRFKRKTPSASYYQRNMKLKKLHNSLFYHEEISHGPKKYIFQISSCSSGCSADEKEQATITTNSITKKRNTSSSSSSSSLSSFSEFHSDINEYKDHVLNLQKIVIQTEFEKLITMQSRENVKKYLKTEFSKTADQSKYILENKNDVTNNNKAENYGDVNDGNDDIGLPEDNNYMLLSFNNIYYNKYQHQENAENQEEPHQVNNMLKQQLQNCDYFNNLNNNINLIKYIDNKTSSVNNITNISNNYSNVNNSSINSSNSSSSCSNEYNKPSNSSTNFIPHKNLAGVKIKDTDVQMDTFKEYQTVVRAVDKNVNGDGNNCEHLQQQFKEWHEVLQLRSYNNELLTVLPYVLLE